MRRDFPLDTLRGLVVFGMLLVGFLPPGVLPEWMYSVHTVPPKMFVDPFREGINWPDMILPLLFFAMGVAIPLDLENRLPPQTEPESLAEANHRLFGWVSTLGRVLWRGLLLAGLSLALSRLISMPLSGAFAAASAASIFAVLRVGRKWTDGGLILQIVCIGLAFVMLMSVPAQGKPGMLAHFAVAYVAAAAIWMLVRRTPSGVLAFTVIVGVLVLVRSSPGWTATFWEWEPIRGWEPISSLRYLLIVLPGVGVGQALLGKNQVEARTDRLVLAGIAFLGLLIMTLAIPAGAFGQALFGIIVLGANALWLCGTHLRQRAIHAWGWGLLGIGTLMTGHARVRPDPGSLSFLLLAAGLCTLLYACVSGIWAFAAKTGQVEVSPDTFENLDLDDESFAIEHGDRPGYFGLIGQNAILGTAICLVALPLLMKETGLRAWREAQSWTPWVDAAFGLGLSVLAGGLIAGLSKLGVRFRA